MDPVSVAASLLTVLGAAGTAARALEHLSNIRHAPDQLLALINEVSNPTIVNHNLYAIPVCFTFVASLSSRQFREPISACSRVKEQGRHL